MQDLAMNIHDPGNYFIVGNNGRWNYAWGSLVSITQLQLQQFVHSNMGVAR